jgi:hypothetical protein
VKALDVDNWARRKGQSYGTILVDLERHKPIDLLPDREASSLAKWLCSHPEVEFIISRDSVPSVPVSVECWAVELAREKGELMVPQEWVGKRVEVDLVRPGPTLMGATYQGTLNAVTDLGIVATLSTDDHPGIEERERFYPWSAVLSIDLSG